MTIVDKKRPKNSHIWQREEREHYVEPGWCSKRLFEVEQFYGSIIDPCCGFGTIPKAAIAAGYTIYAGEKPGGGKQDFCWLVWDKAHTGPATISWLERDVK